ncbi:MAG: DUF488 domain-containing protein [Candidatus Odinarchaeota archaeon]
MIFTSFYGKLAAYPDIYERKQLVVSSNSVPREFPDSIKAHLDWGYRPVLKPEWETVSSYSKGDISEKEFRDRYLRDLEERYRKMPGLFKRLIDLASTSDIVLLCYESNSQFCHRRLAALFLIRKARDLGITLTTACL